MKATALNTHMKLQGELYRAFNFFNDHHSLGLPEPVITVASKGVHKMLGWFSHDIWEVNGEKKHEINICAEHLAKGMLPALQTLVHEIAHLKNFAAGVKDCNDQQRHNKHFKSAAESLGLSCVSLKGSNARFGTAFTELLPETVDLIEKTLKPDTEVFTMFRNEFNELKKKTTKPPTLKPVMVGADLKKTIEDAAKAAGVTQKDYVTNAVTTLQKLPGNIAAAARAIAIHPGPLNEQVIAVILHSALMPASLDS